MTNEQTDPQQHESAGAWAKKYHMASRLVMESVLRPYDLGPTQWYVLHQLAHAGPTPQRDLVRLLHVERATLTGVVAALVRKGLVEQTPDSTDQRQKVLTMTPAGAALWRKLPDPIALILKTAFDGVPQTDIDTTTRVLRTATGRLTNRLSESKET
ncbi:DNA-binding MarR family transcriptional regulator [Streptomyces aurantiacus]|uniref:MarR family winged helix-turn-helix transcriptional regulator n=1 Tax=Streptomyces aurantiacus TaxID=47760 RepID=UPI00278FC66B|nr:MarR family transcriptional regulator [Streptomyces aurantiacus]MDQ0771643.1 DNA-binding MarR family transcriptional regulator [Streptomyces aurantiacus]